MRVFVAGAGGAVGRRLVPMLVARGHLVTGTATSEESAEAIRRLGAEAIVVDGLDAAGIGPHGGIFSVMSIEVVDGRVATIRSVVNPDKLGHLGSVESLRDVMDAAAAGSDLTASP